MSNQDSDDRKPVGRFARLLAATAKTSNDSGLTKRDSDEPKISDFDGRGRISQLVVSIGRKNSSVSHNYCYEYDFGGAN